MAKEPSDEEMIEGASLTPLFKLNARVTLAALRSLRTMAVERGIPLDQLTREQIIESISRESNESRELQRLLDHSRGQTG